MTWEMQRRSRLEIESGGVWVRVPIKNWDILRDRYEQSHDCRVGHSGFSLITNERMRRFWAEFNEGRYMETRHAWNKE